MIMPFAQLISKNATAAATSKSGRKLAQGLGVVSP